MAARPRVQLELAAIRDWIGDVVLDPQNDEVVADRIDFAGDDPVAMLRKLNESWLSNQVVVDWIAGINKTRA